jgi:hypothetical protein
MYTQSTQSSCLQYIQVIPENGLFTMGVAHNSSAAYLQTPVTYTYNYLFNYAGISDYSVAENVKVYPNPASDIITFDLPTNDNYQYQITDITGKIVHTGQLINQNTINISNLTHGFYLIYLQHEDRILTGKVMKL